MRKALSAHARRQKQKGDSEESPFLQDILYHSAEDFRPALASALARRSDAFSQAVTARVRTLCAASTFFLATATALLALASELARFLAGAFFAEALRPAFFTVVLRDAFLVATFLVAAFLTAAFLAMRAFHSSHAFIGQ